jgi:hypothetical protein
MVTVTVPLARSMTDCRTRAIFEAIEKPPMFEANSIEPGDETAEHMTLA